MTGRWFSRRTVLIDDPALLAEGAATSTAAADRERSGRDDPMNDLNLGLLSGMTLPALGRLPWTAEMMPTLDELRDSRRFEFCGLYGTALALVVLPLLGLGLALFLGGYALAYLTPLRGSGPETPPWPGAGWAVLASVVAAGLSFGLFWALGYGWVDPLLRLPFRWPPSRWAWHGFWLAWTTLAGWHGLAWMAARGARNALPEALRATEGPRWWEKTTTVASWLGLGLALVAFVLGYGVEWGGNEAARILAFVLLLLPAAGVCLQWVDGMVGGSSGTYARGRGRYWLTGLAGWILLWGCFALYVGRLEKALARRERVVVPDVVEAGFVAMNVPEGRIAQRTRDHVLRVLAEEGDGTAPGR